MMTIESKYVDACSVPSDINELVPILYDLAKECSHITEMGVRNVVSTWAFIKRDPKTLIGIDLHKYENVELAQSLYPKWKFIEADTLKIEIEPTELLFIDTLHTYEQLLAELTKHAEKVSKYIVLHDTTTYGYTDEPTDWQTPQIMENYKINQAKKGLMQAVADFLAKNSDWNIHQQYTHNNGLLILKRNK